MPDMTLQVMLLVCGTCVRFTMQLIFDIGLRSSRRIPNNVYLQKPATSMLTVMTQDSWGQLPHEPGILVNSPMTAAKHIIHKCIDCVDA